MDLKQFGFNFESDFNVRVLREDDIDIDLIIPLDNKALDLYFDGMPNYVGKRIQCPMIKNIIIRLSKLEDNSLCTIHFLRSIDLHSSVINFEIDYRHIKLKIKDLEYSATLKILKNK